MTTLVYAMNVSLDGYIETLDHGLDWTIIDDELHGWFNEHERAASAFLYGRRLYETMAAYWPNYASDPNATPTMRTYGEIWNPKPKVVFSSTLTDVAHNSRLVRGDPIEEYARLRTKFDGELHVGGPTLASAFVRADLVDRYQLMVHPVVLGAGTPFWPPLDHRIGLRLVDTHRFTSGAVLLDYLRA
jgi:dihydrofolate reductase